MGAINEVFCQEKISFSIIEEMLNSFLESDVYKEHNLKILQEIGIINEYLDIINHKHSNELINFSKNNKCIKKLVSSTKTKELFVSWIKALFDIHQRDLQSSETFNEKFSKLKLSPLNRAFFIDNLSTNLLKINKLINYGIPKNFRELVWDLFIAEKYTNYKYFHYEEESKEYQKYLEHSGTNAQIERDLQRTFVNNSDKTIKNFQKLKNVLTVFTKLNDGYCQGMNFIAGFLLKLTNFNEVKTFYIIKNILDDIKGYFEDGFPSLKKNLEVFDNSFKELYPTLYSHFKNNELYNELWVGKWIQTLFTLNLPFEELTSIWDVLMLKGFDYIIYICLAILESLEKHLLKLNDSSDILDYINNVLNPTVTSLIYKNQLEKENFFIPLSEILLKASVLEKKIKGKNILPLKNRIIQKKLSTFRKSQKINLYSTLSNDYDSVNTKESENISKVSSFSSRMTNSSSNTDSLKLLKDFNLSNPETKITQLKNDLCLGTINDKPKVQSNKNINSFNLLAANDIKINATARGSVNTINSNLSNLRNSYNINYPQPNQKCKYNSSTNYVTINKPQYMNYLIYYPI